MVQRSANKTAAIATEIPKAMVHESLLILARLHRPFDYYRSRDNYRSALSRYFAETTLQEVWLCASLSSCLLTRLLAD
jgi:hypothetical protein